MPRDLENALPTVSQVPPAGPLINVENSSGVSWFQAFLENNPYFQAGFGLMVQTFHQIQSHGNLQGLGVGLTVMRQGLVLGTTALRRRMLVTLEINNKDRAYEWFLGWMANQANSPTTASRWMRSHQLSVDTMIEQRKNGSSSALFKLVAGPGTHYFKYSGAWMQVKRERETRSMQLMSGVPWETVTLTTLSKDRGLFPKLLSEARDLAMKGQEGKLVIHTAWGIEWRPFGQPRRKRPLKSVVLHPGISEKIEQDIKSFLERRQWGLADDKLNHLLSNAPERSFVLIEDVDAAFNKRVQTTEDGYQSSVTFSGFLNALDGVASGEERIIFMTTNHVEKLDPALIRPGRVDISELIDDSSAVQAKTLFTQFYGGSENMADDEVERLACSLEEIVTSEKQVGRRVSMAALQGLFIRNNARSALRGCRDLFTQRT
ncbi:hypothetical protein H0H92_000049 [Tricholoma furcatifolium]|nr:hypothetical protein H0H92_000049 [Tricholoma furcatifolium]